MQLGTWRLCALAVILTSCSPTPPPAAPGAGGRCDVAAAAVDRAYRASGAGTSADGREAIKAVKVRRCLADQWPDGALDCAARAANIPDLSACRGKLLADQAHALAAQEALVRDDWEQFLADSETMKTKMCTCPDRACAVEINKEARERGLVQRPHRHHDDDAAAPEPPHDVAELVAKHAQGLEDCSVKLGGSPMAAAMAKMRGFTDEMCQCKDSGCAQKVSDEMVKWANQEAKDWDADMKPDEDETKQMAEITQRMTECMTKAMSANPPSP